MLPVTFSIFGTCVSIEIFDYNKDGRLIRTNPLRCNSIFSVSNRFPSYLNIKHKSSYIQPMLRTMFDGTTFDWLKANQGEYLIIDLIEERFPLLKASGTYLLKSRWWEQSNIDSTLKSVCGGGIIINQENLPEDFVVNKINEFANLVTKIYKPEKIIIHEAYLVDTYIDLNGRKQNFKNYNKIMEINQYLSKYYKILENILKDCRIIKMPEATFGDESHLQGLSPVHFCKEYYKLMYDKINQIVKNDEFNSRNIGIIEESLPNRNRIVIEQSQKYGLPPYLSNFLGLVSSKYDFANKRVLQIGTPRISNDIARKVLQVEKWVNINLDDCPVSGSINIDDLNKPIIGSLFENMMEKNNYLSFTGCEDNFNSCLYNKFDIVISRSYIESTQNIEILLDIIYKCLRKQGEFFGMLGPIWSGAGGSKWHLGEYNFNNSDIIPRFAHLLTDRAELHRILENISSEYNNYYYMNNVLNGSKEAKLNKLFFEDYEYYMDNSLFSYKSIAPVQTIKLTDAERSALNKRYPEKNDLM